jgi:acyl-coenzyme A synthetase/AMP-(fatty) acid ligase
MKMLKENKITVLSMVPTILHYISNYFDELHFPDLRYSFFSGDALHHSLAAKWKRCIPNAVVHNFYGPTETTIVCTRYIWNETDSAQEPVNGIVPLGKLFPQMEFLITDERCAPVGIHEKGELCFSGVQVIEKYLNNENEEAFFLHNGKRFYRTGDLVSMNEKRNLVFLGRKDSQVKINGYRIELSEVEETIRLATGCRTVACTDADSHGLNYLCAFIESKNHDEKEVRGKVAETLPAYMLPKKIIFVDKIPLTINNKTDKAELLQLLNVRK